MSQNLQDLFRKAIHFIHSIILYLVNSFLMFQWKMITLWVMFNGNFFHLLIWRTTVSLLFLNKFVYWIFFFFTEKYKEARKKHLKFYHLVVLTFVLSLWDFFLCKHRSSIIPGLCYNTFFFCFFEETMSSTLFNLINLVEHLHSCHFFVLWGICFREYSCAHILIIAYVKLLQVQLLDHA